MNFMLGREYVAVHCGHSEGGCGLEFAMSVDFYRMTKEQGRHWYCPNGHRRVWGDESTTTKLQKAEAREVHLKDQLRAAVRDAEESRVALLRDRQRFANGVCPCCNRSFENVRQHMTTKHPEYRAKLTATPIYKCSCGQRFESFRGLRVHQGKTREDTGTYRWDDPKTSRYWAHLTEVAK